MINGKDVSIEIAAGAARPKRQKENGAADGKSAGNSRDAGQKKEKGKKASKKRLWESKDPFLFLHS
ncbi:MAG: hypothetical protein MUO63_00895, partial [Desulfobulbaceae bacterium]|nr:hypothetical protein [Desulfobulbaceae bacterium]